MPKTVIAIDDAVNPFVRQAVAYWRSLCGQRRLPARAELTLRGTAPFLPYSVIVSCIEGGADFEYRHVGEAQREVFKALFKGLRVSQIETMAPQLGGLLRAIYEQVRATGVPLLVRGEVDHEPENSKMLYHETVFLPLGSGEVDHLLIVGVQVPAPFWDVKPDALSTFATQAAPV